MLVQKGIYSLNPNPTNSLGLAKAQRMRKIQIYTTKIEGLDESSYLQIIDWKTIIPIKRNQHLFTGALHYNSTLNCENDMCHVVPPCL